VNTVFLVIFVVLQGLDIWTTHTALKMGKREANPFLAYLFTRFPPVPTMVVVKAVAVVALWYAGYWFLTAVLCLMYLWVVDNNWKVIQDSK